MGHTMGRGAPALIGASFIGLLLAGVSSAALAAPADGAKLAAMQQQIDELNRQMAEMRAAQATADADIITLKTPQGATVTPSLPNGKPALATADGRFTANIRAIVMFDAGKYFQKDDLA